MTTECCYTGLERIFKVILPYSVECELYFEAVRRKASAGNLTGRLRDRARAEKTCRIHIAASEQSSNCFDSVPDARIPAEHNRLTKPCQCFRVHSPKLYKNSEDYNLKYKIECNTIKKICVKG